MGKKTNPDVLDRVAYDLASAINWGATEEGYYYWIEVYGKLLDIISEARKAESG